MTKTKQAVAETISEWFTKRVPAAWFDGDPTVEVDGEEILVVGRLAAASEETEGDEAGRVRAFRERTRDDRIRIAGEAEATFGRKVSWGAMTGETTRLFTTLSTPAMTRLRLPERRVLDLLIEGGVARSRSDALAWCVRLVAQNQSEWLADLRDALVRVRDVRTEGPSPT